MYKFLHAWGWIIVPAVLMYIALIAEWWEERKCRKKK